MGLGGGVPLRVLTRPLSQKYLPFCYKRPEQLVAILLFLPGMYLCFHTPARVISSGSSGTRMSMCIMNVLPVPQLELTNNFPRSISVPESSWGHIPHGRTLQVCKAYKKESTTHDSKVHRCWVPARGVKRRFVACREIGRSFQMSLDPNGYMTQ